MEMNFEAPPSVVEMRRKQGLAREAAGDVRICLIPVEEFRRVKSARIGKYAKLALIADMCRMNALAAVKRAGSGHLGSSFSAMDIIVLLYHAMMNVAEVGVDDPNRDVFFSSKGHDVPGLYSVLYSLGIVPKERLMMLRRLGGLDGHPDIKIPGIEANSGSLGMGISKGKGIAFAKRLLGRKGRVFVMTGDGELQEGQIYESMQTTAHQKIANLTVIVDHNKLQSDKYVSEIIGLGDLEEKFRAFGWHVARCNGHDVETLEALLAGFEEIADRPKVLIADTIKGRGVSFMEHPVAVAAGGGYYRWHAGAPDDASFTAGYEELLIKVNERLAGLGLDPLAVEEVSREEKKPSGVTSRYVAAAFGDALVELGERHENLVVLDGDLAADCRIRGFEQRFPGRFIENGIAEQDMVSMAGALARHGLLPVVNSFASFLFSRANEQIYNNATELSKVIYVGHYAGLIPAGPGKSHQSIRDISLVGALPNSVILEPCNLQEAALIARYCVEEAKENCFVRLVIGPCPRDIELPADYRLVEGRGAVLAEGADALLVGYGPVLLHEALLAAETLGKSGLGVRVVNMPWLNRVDASWLREIGEGIRHIFVLDDHAPYGGLGDRIINSLVSVRRAGEKSLTKFSVEGFPACGTPPEALAYHGLDGASIAKRMLQEMD